MATAKRFQRIYDHRLKGLVHETGDIELAVRHGVPCSTARGWLRSRRDVVTLEVLEATEHELRQEILALRRVLPSSSVFTQPDGEGPAAMPFHADRR